MTLQEGSLGRWTRFCGNGQLLEVDRGQPAAEVATGCDLGVVRRAPWGDGPVGKWFAGGHQVGIQLGIDTVTE
jgi:hypothetical protein